ncbi:MAG TPA: acyl-CoA dehydrogenase family protein [Gemmatimonadaceae bacterium]|nr:acyl-CoA dehydrogenase family protein [Gemmatimonadaceae bacterium]
MSVTRESQVSVMNATRADRAERQSPRLPDADIIQMARELTPLIRQHADDGEKQGRLARPVVEALANAGMFRLWTPRALGGLELDPITYMRIGEELAAADTAAAWILQAGNTGSWWSARLPEEGPREIFASGPSVLIAGAFHPPQRAVEVPGGYRISGRAPLASNIHDSDWLFLTGIIMDGEHPRAVDGVPQLVGVYVEVSAVQIIDTWSSLGMRATDSNDVAMDNVFVPASRAFPLVPEFQPSQGFEGPLYRFPAMGGAVAVIAPVALAIARGAIDELRALAANKTPLGFNRTMRERPVVQATLAKAEGIYRSARAFLYDALGEAWERACAGEHSTLQQKADVLLPGVHAVSSAATVVEMMHRLAGTAGIYTRNRLERHLRDIETVRHHGLSSENRLEAVGQVYLGVPLEFPFLAF